MTLLHVGSSGAAVRSIERRLEKLGFLDEKADGRFDQKTGKAVVAFKQENGWENPKPVAGKKLADALKVGDGFEGDPAKKHAMKGGTYNCLIGRDPKKVQDAVKHLAKSNQLDFIQLQEISQYHKVLNDIPGYQLITFPGAKDHGESGILVKDGIKVGKPQSIEADSGWISSSGHHAAPRAATSVLLDGWLKVTSVHLPPAIDFKNGHATGAHEARQQSYISLMKKLEASAERFEKNHPGSAMLIGGDWNEGPNSSGVGSPHWLAQMAKMKTYAMGHIDWEMAHGAKVSNAHRRNNAGSDHSPWTFTVTQG